MCTHMVEPFSTLLHFPGCCISFPGPCAESQSFGCWLSQQLDFNICYSHSVQLPERHINVILLLKCFIVAKPSPYETG